MLVSIAPICFITFFSPCVFLLTSRFFFTFLSPFDNPTFTLYRLVNRRQSEPLCSPSIRSFSPLFLSPFLWPWISAVFWSSKLKEKSLEISNFPVLIS
ncbi:hypothetical protein [Phaffia rhodozyma]|uniref:Uncharacterized protein n=1 Tax=Phaffia rhodozyma TaxID=264483 RepID=A0A0F7SG06_PHARH|nr:hypothetical protein [Phaffia rhodozyma]